MSVLTSAGPSAGQVAGRRFKRAWGVGAFLLALIVAAIVLAALRPEKTAGYLDPESPSPDGGRALAEILRQHGTPVDVSRSARNTVERSRPESVIVVTHAERLTATDLDLLAATPGDLLLVEPTQATLDKLMPGVRKAAAGAGADSPDCPLAQAWGDVEFGFATTYEAVAPAAFTNSCYLDENLPRLAQVTGTRTVTVLGSGRPLTNEELDEPGSAALGMNLIGGVKAHAVWLMPDLPSTDAAGDTSFVELIPFGVKLFVLQLLVALACVALWRSRRLGPVVAERLPVLVRSAETVEGRARLYRAAHARDRAAVALREGARDRLVPKLGMGRSAATDPARAQEITIALAARSGLDQHTVGWALYGTEPVDDHELIRLTDLLDDLEMRVR